MKKSFFAILCMASMNLNAQTTGSNPSPGLLASTIEPWSSNRYVSWPVPYGSTSVYKVNVYVFGPNGGRNGVLVSSTVCDQNYYRFSPEEMESKDLKYTIAEYNATTGGLINESQPAAIGNTYPDLFVCGMDCNGQRESYRLSIWQKVNGSTYLTASDDAGIYHPATSTLTRYYQAISDDVYYQLPSGHPYRAMKNNGEPVRDHIRIEPTAPVAGGTVYYDANNSQVQNGWLVEKRMDKYKHFDGSHSGTYEPNNAWCYANIGTATGIYNNYVDPSTINGVTSDQYWFLNQTGTTPTGSPVFDDIPDELVCTGTFGIGGNGSGEEIIFQSLMDTMISCFETAASPIDCIIDTDLDGEFDDFGIGFNGLTFESVNNISRFSASVVNDGGDISVTGTSGTYSSGLYRINLFLADGRIIPGYRSLNIGVPSVVDSTVLTIAPNPIVNSELAFDVVSTTNKTVTLLVQKLDGSTFYTESVTLTANTTLSKVIPVTGTVPYNQLRVSVITPNGTSIQKTALTQ